MKENLMKEYFEYIKEAGEDIKELNDQIKRSQQECIKLQQVNGDLRVKLNEKDNELKNLRRLANKWYQEYDDLYCRYENLEALYDAMAIALAQIAPNLLSDVKEDREEPVWSDIIDNFHRNR